MGKRGGEKGLDSLRPNLGSQTEMQCPVLKTPGEMLWQDPSQFPGLQPQLFQCLSPPYLWLPLMQGAQTQNIMKLLPCPCQHQGLQERVMIVPISQALGCFTRGWR